MAIIDNLVAYYSLDEGIGDAIDAHDDNDLTDNFSVGSAAGKVGNARDFEAATGHYLSIADNADLSMGDIDFTIQAWVNLESEAFGRIVGKVDSTAEYFIFYDDGSDRFGFQVSPDGSAVTTVTANAFGAVTAATWYHIIAWHDASANEIRIVVNAGTSDGESHTTGVFNGTNQFTISHQGAPFDGLIDEVGVWKRVLTSEERTWLYNAGNGRSYADIVAGMGTATDAELLIAPVGFV